MCKQNNIVCKILGHKWDWYLPCTQNTIVGTQWYIRCKRVFRGIYTDKRNTKV